VVTDFAPAARQVQDSVVAGPVRRLYDRLRASGATGIEPTTLVVARHEMVNAFAAPGGTVVVTTGLLRALRSPDELAAVLAHEAGHVRRRHALRGLLRQASLQVLLGLVAGDASALSSGLQAAGALSGLSHSREDEGEADLDALASLARAALPPRALAGALESIRGASPDGPELGFLSTHPSTPDRLERIKRALAKLPHGDVREVVTPEQWRRMREALPPKAAEH
jgi:predicted Zn-dependent protease